MSALLQLPHPATWYRQTLRQASFPGFLIANAVSSNVRLMLRRRLAGISWKQFDWPTLGHYAYVDAVLDPTLWRDLRNVAESVVTRKLRVTRSRCMRLAHHDYTLKQADDYEPWRNRRLIELQLDISTGTSGEAEVLFEDETRRRVFVVPQVPGCLSLVVRAPRVRRYDRYLTHRVGRAVVYRIRLTLAQ